MSRASRAAQTVSRARLLAGAAALGAAILGAPAFAQTPPAQPVAVGPAADGLEPGAFYLEANRIVANDKNKTVTAQGDVEVRYQGRTLRAQQVTYNQKTGVVTAAGQATLINPDGSIQFADSLTLDDQMRAGVIQGFSTRLPGDVKIAAATAVRRSETLNELNKAIYTPCPVCVDANGHQQGPSWSIRADKVVQDKKRQIIYYRNATIIMLGVPVFYTPVFWHADPTVPGEKSGLLAPRIAASRRRGLSWEQPYLWAISPYQDLVISPQINTKVNPFLNLTYRKRFWSGELNVRGGYTYESDLKGDGERFGDRTNRSYVLANGGFDINDYWRWGFSAERTSDDLIFDKYDIQNVYEQRGLFATEDRRLTSQLYATRQDQRSYLSISALSFQGLRPSDIDRAFPLVAPLIEARWEPYSPVLGGRLRLRGSGVVLTREQSTALNSTRNDPGMDSKRASGELDWRSNYTFTSGLRLSPFLNARGDVYHITDLPGGGSKSASRLVGAAGFDVSWPFFRRDGDRTIILEPLAQVALSPDVDQIVIGRDANGPIYFNEDSLALAYDETNLFRVNKFAGFDLYEGGQRLNLGGRASVVYDDGRHATVLVGRSFRSEDNALFPSYTGLQRASSDWIVAAEAVPMHGLQIFSRARLGAEDLALRRIEAGADVNLPRGDGFIRYLRDENDPMGFRREDVDFAGNVQLYGNWGVTFRGVRDLERDVWRREEFGPMYRNQCLDLAVVWVHEETFNRTVGPSDSVQVRLTLATLGDKGYSQ
ncbi:MAG: LPS-assembly protein LptD [Parcubacteria group bacterium]